MGRGANVNHPPIPPKSAHFYQDPNPIEKQIDWPWVFAYAEQYVTEAGLETKSIMCAVAEVEWDKRARRWQELGERIIGRMLEHKNGTTGYLRKFLNPRANRYYSMSQKCLNTAEQWRAWGAK